MAEDLARPVPGKLDWTIRIMHRRLHLFSDLMDANVAARAKVENFANDSLPLHMDQPDQRFAMVLDE